MLLAKFPASFELCSALLPLVALGGLRIGNMPARALGAGDAAIVRRHILRNILSPLIVVATTQVAGAIMAEAALSFLGLGLPVTQPSLGTLIRSGYDLIFAGITVLLGLTLVSMLVTVIPSSTRSTRALPQVDRWRPQSL